METNNEHQQAEKELFMRTRENAAKRLAEARGTISKYQESIGHSSERARAEISREIIHGKQSRPDNAIAHQNKTIDERVADLEIRVFRLWDLLTEKSLSTGQPKLNKIGRRFAENLKFR